MNVEYTTDDINIAECTSVKEETEDPLQITTGDS